MPVRVWQLLEHRRAQVCDTAEAECETILEAGQSRVLPSTTRFAARFQACRKRFDAVCIGPGSARQVGLLFCWRPGSLLTGRNVVHCMSLKA